MKIMFKNGAWVNVNEDKKKIKRDKLEFNTYCVFAEDKQNIDETIGLIFKDYIEKLKSNTK